MTGPTITYPDLEQYPLTVAQHAAILEIVATLPDHATVDIGPSDPTPYGYGADALAQITSDEIFPDRLIIIYTNGVQREVTA